MNWPTAPADYRAVRRAYYEGCLPPIGGLSVKTYPGSGPAVTVRYTGYWIYLVPRELWDGIPRQAKWAISALYRAGYNSITQIRDAQNCDLLDARGVGHQSLGVLRQWLHSVERTP